MNRRIIIFLIMVCLFVGGFIWHIQRLGCNDTNGFDVSCHKMYMSFGVLFCIGILLLTAAGFYILLDPPQNANIDYPARNVFDSFAKQLIPIATLVLGYYFGTSSSILAAGPSDKPKNTVEVEKPKEGASAASPFSSSVGAKAAPIKKDADK